MKRQLRTLGCIAIVVRRRPRCGDDQRLTVTQRMATARFSDFRCRGGSNTSRATVGAWQITSRRAKRAEASEGLSAH
jgi:hypothetical protein